MQKENGGGEVGGHNPLRLVLFGKRMHNMSVSEKTIFPKYQLYLRNFLKNNEF